MVSASAPPLAGKGLVHARIIGPCGCPGATVTIVSAGTLPAEPPPTRYKTVKLVPGRGEAPKFPSPKRIVVPPSPS